MRKLAAGGPVSKQTKVDMHIFGLGLQSYAPQVDEAIQLIEKRGQVKGGKVRSVANFLTILRMRGRHAVARRMQALDARPLTRGANTGAASTEARMAVVAAVEVAGTAACTVVVVEAEGGRCVLRASLLRLVGACRSVTVAETALPEAAALAVCLMALMGRSSPRCGQSKSIIAR